MKILVSAYACSPFQGSEPGVGWGFVTELAKHHDLWVIVEEKFRDDIECYLAEYPDFAEHVHFHFIPKERNRRLRKLWPPSYYWYYRRWHEHAFDLANELHQKINFDIAHQLTMVGFREPGYLWRLNVPFVWGPVGGMGLFPWRFLPSLGLYGALYYLGYNVLNSWQMRFARRPKLAAGKAKNGLIAATPENLEGARRYWGVECAHLICEVGLPQLAIESPKRREKAEPLQIVWTGVHEPRKALNLALRALARIPKEVNWQLNVLGEGRQTGVWRALAKELGVADRCIFHGWQPRSDVLAIMQGSHLMMITSLRDLTSTVTLEAMAAGLPTICLDHCGFSGVVNESCGIKVAVKSPGQVVSDLAAAVQRLASNEEIRYELAEGAQTQAQAYIWQSKVDVVNSIYEQKLAACSQQI